MLLLLLLCLFSLLEARASTVVVTWGTSGTNVPTGLTNVVMVAQGTSHSLALNNDGTIIAWGNNTYKQTNLPPGLSIL